MAALTLHSSSSSHVKEWLSLPCDLAINDSFADDLIRQFDKKRSDLHKDLEQEQHQQQQSRKSSSSSSRLAPTTPAPPPPPVPPTPPKSSSPSRSKRAPRQSSAGELLRRSSAFFKTTLDSTWKNISQSHENLPTSSCKDQHHQHQDDSTQVPFLPETIAIHTTITFPPVTKKTSSTSFPPLLLSPPVISQYPPKPLQYSPVVTPAEHYSTAKSSSSPHKTLMHRLSMPALRHHASTSDNQHRHHLSDSANIPFFIKRKKSSQL